MQIYFRFVANGKMSVNFTFENEYFETKIEGFETSRKSYANSSSNKKKTNKLPKKVSTSLKSQRKKTTRR